MVPISSLGAARAHGGRLVARTRTAPQRLQPRLQRAAERALERRYGIDTSGFVYLEDFGLDASDRVWHHPSEWLALRRALRRLDIGRRDVFVDLGSGKGRAVFAAALEFPFRRVIGIELAAELHRQAVANVERNADRLRCRDVVLINADIAQCEIPDDATVVYLYSPVIGETFDAVMRQVIASVDRRPRLLRVLYNFPFEHARVLATGRMRVVDVQSARWPLRDRAGGAVIVTYVVVPTTEVADVQAVLAAAPAALRGAEEWFGPHSPGLRLVRAGGLVHAEQRR